MTIIILRKILNIWELIFFHNKWVDENSMMVYGNSFRIYL